MISGDHTLVVATNYSLSVSNTEEDRAVRQSDNRPGHSNRNIKISSKFIIVSLLCQSQPHLEEADIFVGYLGGTGEEKKTFER